MKRNESESAILPRPSFRASRSRVRSDNDKDDENGARLIYSRRNVEPAFNCPLTAGTKCRFHGRPHGGNALNDVARSTASCYIPSTAFFLHLAAFFLTGWIYLGGDRRPRGGRPLSRDRSAD